MTGKATVYHGSQFIIKKPVFGEGNPLNDYGLGFYCTHDAELAKEWACTAENSGYANTYELDMTNLSVMNLSGADYNILNWLAVLLNYRKFRISSDVAAEGKAYLLEKFLPDTSMCDIIVGYRADDSYFSFANAFLNNTLTLERLEIAMYLGELGEQTVLKTKRAFEQIAFVRSEVADREVYYTKRSARDREARAIYRRERGQIRASDSVYLMDILRGGWSSDDVRIRRNISG